MYGMYYTISLCNHEKYLVICPYFTDDVLDFSGCSTFLGYKCNYNHHFNTHHIPDLLSGTLNALFHLLSITHWNKYCCLYFEE